MAKIESRHRISWIFILLCCCGPLLACQSLSSQNAVAPSRWKLTPLPLEAGHWQTRSDGYGQVDFAPGQLRLRPRSAQLATETHAALILSRSQHQYFRLRVDYQHIQQLRQDQPNPWEVFWIAFNYKEVSPSQNPALRAPSKQSNYFAYKTNGVELGRMFGSVEQHFLFTQATATQLGRHRLELERGYFGVRIWVDGKEVVNFLDQAWPDALYDHVGPIGLYVEDAEVRIESVSIEELPTFP